MDTITWKLILTKCFDTMTLLSHLQTKTHYNCELLIFIHVFKMWNCYKNIILNIIKTIIERYQYIIKNNSITQPILLVQ